MDLAGLDVGVIGLGTAGMASGILLAEAGASVTLYERVAEPGAVGAGIVLQPTGLAVLHRLGLAERLLRMGHPIARLVADTHRGRRLFDLAYGAVDPQLTGLGMHRGTLFTALWERLRALPGATVRCGVDVVDVASEGEAVVPLAAGGERLGSHAVVVVANGARSGLRASAALPRSSAAPYPWGALWYTGPLDAAIPSHTLTQVVRGTERMVGLLPMGRGPKDTEEQVTLYWSIRCDRVDAFYGGDLAAWKDEVLGLQPLAAALVDRIERLDDLIFSDYVDVKMWPWHRGRVAVLGDAAHAMSPQLGQGCNMALIDAAHLADALAGAATVADGLAAYTQARRHQLRWYQWANRWCTPWFQSDGRLRGWVRDLGFGLASRLPVFHGQMVRTMMGVKRGFVRRSDDLAPLRRALPPA